MEARPITHPMYVLFGPTLVELGQYLSFFHREHGIAELNDNAIRELLASSRRATPREAVLASGASACHGLWRRWLATAFQEANPAEAESWSSAVLLERLTGDVPSTQPDPVGDPTDELPQRPLPVPNAASRHVCAAKERVFGTGMARDFTLMLSFHRLSDVWGARGRSFFDPMTEARWDEAGWCATARQQVQPVHGEDSLKRLVWVAGLPVATAISLAFDVVEILARKRPESVSLGDDAVAIARAGLQRLCKRVAWPTIIALGECRRAGRPL